MAATHWPGTKPPHTLPDTPDVIEARARRLMAYCASLKPRGWNGLRERNDALARLDVLLDEWNAATSRVPV